jgi:Flp pilus assembly protein TadD
LAISTPFPAPADRERELPSAAVPLARQAQAALLQGQFAQAEHSADEALRIAPTHPELLRLSGVAMYLQGRSAPAIPRLREAAAAWPEDALIESNLGVALAQSGDLDAATRAFQRSTELDPTLLDTWLNLARALELRGDAAGAHAAYGAVLELDPSRHAVRVLRAAAASTLGRIDEAEAELRTVLHEHADSASAWIALFNLKAIRADGEDSREIARLYASDTLEPSRRIGLGFAYASVLEAEARYAEAFEVFGAANAAKRAGVRWDAAAVSALVDAILTAFAASPAQPTTSRGDDLIFLVGLPRSGSTLAEQILAAHPDVAGGGETNMIAKVLQDESKRRGQRFPAWVDAADDADWARLGDDYLARIAASRRAGAIFTDKTLPNWQVLGAIRRMLPGARIVHCRRDPLETCWSCYKHNFGEAQFFTYDFAELAAFHRDCERAMRYWHAQSPTAIHAHVYEDLLADPESTVRALLAHCGLAFDPACLRFHEVERDVHTASAAQVRRPLRGDVAVAARYGALLDPLRRALL